MAQDETKPIGPICPKVFPLISLPMAKCSSVMLAEKTSYWCGGDRTFSRSGRIARTIMGHLPKDGDTVRCPWHHACFDLRTGEALAAPALSPIACWPVEQRDGKIWVSEKRFQKRSAWRSRQWFPQGSAGAAINKEWPGLSPRLESGSGWRTLQSLEGNQIESEKAH